MDWVARGDDHDARRDRGNGEQIEHDRLQDHRRDPPNTAVLETGLDCREAITAEEWAPAFARVAVISVIGREPRARVAWRSRLPSDPRSRAISLCRKTVPRASRWR